MKLFVNKLFSEHISLLGIEIVEAEEVLLEEKNIRNEI